ncbi:hypothetical protein [Streptomyces sp. NPDC051452]|uniref:hypothetical protein n=1 Tax=Streptomyces sp. NPDC051452 TaxID=3365654 RepID=UPI0037A9CB36
MDHSTSLTADGVDAATEALTPGGWRSHDALRADDHILTMDLIHKRIRWTPISGLNRHRWVSDQDGPLIRWSHRSVSALTTPGHRWMEQSERGRKNGQDLPHQWSTTADLRGRNWARLVFGGGTPSAFDASSPYSDEFIELLGWIITEGCFPKPQKGGFWNHVSVSQSERANPEGTQRLRRLASYFTSRGYTFKEHKRRADGVIPFYIGADLGAEIRATLPGKQLPPLLISSLTLGQARILYDALIAGDGHRHEGGGHCWTQVDQGRIDSFQMLAALLGSRTAQKTWKALNGVYRITVYTRDGGTSGSTHPAPQDYTGVVWHPVLPADTAWAARRQCTTYWTGTPAARRREGMITTVPGPASAPRAAEQDALF